MFAFCRVVVIALLFSPLAAMAGENCSDAYDKSGFFDFRQACFKHDVCYSEAGLLGFKRDECDTRFLREMRASCAGRSFVCNSTAHVYYLAVRQGAGDSFDAAQKKSDKIRALIKANKDKKMQQLLKTRRSGQDAYMKITKACLQQGVEMKRCMKEREKIKVPDYPFEYNLGGCNLLGINWVKGHREQNAKKMANLTGLSENQILNGGNGDICEDRYPQKSN
ncbi:MAG: hypothetical protein KF767_01555 [Bdellovibrionaceae bacterium]|nr:hypothetical protein [Pseudobdellovibrionaceae bacterium]